MCTRLLDNVERRNDGIVGHSGEAACKTVRDWVVAGLVPAQPFLEELHVCEPRGVNRSGSGGGADGGARNRPHRWQSTPRVKGWHRPL